VSATLLVELHDFLRLGVSQVIQERFAGTHDVTIISTSERDPSRYPELQSLRLVDQIAAIAEGRPTAMQWAFMEPKNRI